MKLKEMYEKLYENIKSGKYDVRTLDKNTFESKISISLIDLLKDCDKEGANIESFLRHAKEQETCIHKIGVDVKCKNCKNYHNRNYDKGFGFCFTWGQYSKDEKSCNDFETITQTDYYVKQGGY